LEKLLEVLALDPRLGAVGPMILSPDGAPQHHCASRQLSLARQLAWHFRFPTGQLFLSEVVGPHGARRTERLSGAAIAVRCEVVREVGLLDERFFMYYEDADWVLRIRRAGYIVACVTDARVIHQSGASAEQDPLARSDHAIESELAYFAKHEGSVSTLLLRAGILVTSALRAVSLDAVLALSRDQRHRLLADFRAIRSCLRP
jgi:GT2 family glycosyltransferase